MPANKGRTGKQPPAVACGGISRQNRAYNPAYTRTTAPKSQHQVAPETPEAEVPTVRLSFSSHTVGVFVFAVPEPSDLQAPSVLVWMRWTGVSPVFRSRVSPAC